MKVFINHFFVAFVILLAFVDSNTATAQAKDSFWTKFDQKGKTLEFITQPIIADTSNCYAFQYINGKAVDTLHVIPNSGKNRNNQTRSWQVSLKEGLYDLRITLMDTLGNVYTCSYNDVNYKHFGYWILSVGTGDNQPKGSPLDNLPCSPDDAQTFVRIIREKINQEAEISELLIGPLATKDSIKSAFRRIGLDVESKKGRFEEEAVFVYFSGHGKDGDLFNSNFQFQVKDVNGFDGVFLKEEGITKMLEGLFEKGREDTLSVWFFIDACESERFCRSGNQSKVVLPQKLVVYSSAITNGNKYKKKSNVEKKECGTILDFIERVKEGEPGNCRRIAIDGLYLNCLECYLKGIDSAIRYDDMSNTIKSKYYNKELTDPFIISDITPYFPYESFQSGLSSGKPSIYIEKSFPSCFIDVSIGWNLSHQSIAQIGFTWKKWSVFADLSGNWNWEASITHTLKEIETQQLQDTLIKGLGMGLRWYPLNLKRVDLGLSVSAQPGVVYGEKVISELETIKHLQPYWGITPAASLRWFTSKNYCFMLFFNVGYAFYFPYAINEDLKWRSAVTNFGVSIPVCCKNKRK